MRDDQRSKIYDWEWSVIPHWDQTKVPYKDAQEIVNLIWHEEGFKYPPKIMALRPNATATGAQAIREGSKLIIQIKRKWRTRAFILIHEIAHHMLEKSTGADTEAIHGPKFMGIYMKLLRKYLSIPLIHLMVRAHQNGIRYNLRAKPTVGRLERARDRKKAA
jgi:hypothetical protein